MNERELEGSRMRWGGSQLLDIAEIGTCILYAGLFSSRGQLGIDYSRD